MSQSKKTPQSPESPDRLQLSLDELELDVSAFIHYLKVKGGSNSAESASYWSLIPQSLEFSFSGDVEDYRLEKEVFSRKLWIVSKEVPETQKEERKAILFGIFESAITTNQIKAVTRLLKNLKPESRSEIIKAYSNFLETQEGKGIINE